MVIKAPKGCARLAILAASILTPHIALGAPAAFQMMQGGLFGDGPSIQFPADHPCHGLDLAECGEAAAALATELDLQQTAAVRKTEQLEAELEEARARLAELQQLADEARTTRAAIADLPGDHPCQGSDAIACATIAAQLSINLSSANQEIVRLRETIEALTEQNQTAAETAERIVTVEAQLETAAAEIASLEAANSSAEAQIASMGEEAEEAARLLVDAGRSIEELEGEVARLSAALASAPTAAELPPGHVCAGMAAEACAVVAAGLAERLQKLEAERRDVERELGALEARIGLSDELLSERKAEIDRLRSRLDERNKRVSALEVETVELGTKLAQSEARLATLEAAAAEVPGLPATHPCKGISASDCAARAQSLAEAKASLEQELSKAASELETVAATLEARSVELAALQEQVDELGEQLQAANARSASAETRLAEANDQIARLETEIVEQLDIAIAAETDLSEKLAAALKAEQEALRRAEALASELGDAQAEANALRTGQGELRAELAARDAKLSQLEATAAGLKDALEAEEKRAAELGDTLAAAEDRIAALETALTEAGERAEVLEASLTTERNALSALQAEIDRLTPMEAGLAGAQTRIEALSGEVAACQQALENPDCSADPALMNAIDRLSMANDRISELETGLAASQQDLEAAATEAAEVQARLEDQLERMTSALDDAVSEFEALSRDLAASEANLATARTTITGLEDALASLERDNERLSGELRAARDIPLVQNALSSLPCAPQDVVVAPGVEIPVIATSRDSVLRIQDALAGVGPGFVITIGLSEPIPGAGCPTRITAEWAAMKWDGEPADVPASFMGASEAKAVLGRLPDAGLCRSLSGDLEGIGARFWVRNGGQLALCDVSERDLDQKRAVERSGGDPASADRARRNHRGGMMPVTTSLRSPVLALGLALSVGTGAAILRRGPCLAGSRSDRGAVRGAAPARTGIVGCHRAGGRAAPGRHRRGICLCGRWLLSRRQRPRHAGWDAAFASGDLPG